MHTNGAGAFATNGAALWTEECDSSLSAQSFRLTVGPQPPPSARSLLLLPSRPSPVPTASLPGPAVGFALQAGEQGHGCAGWRSWKCMTYVCGAAWGSTDKPTNNYNHQPLHPGQVTPRSAWIITFPPTAITVGPESIKLPSAVGHVRVQRASAFCLCSRSTRDNVWWCPGPSANRNVKRACV
jgi:hypothetical protein